MTPTETASRLRRLANDWREEEKRLCEQFGDEIVPRSMRARRIKDTKAIDAAVEIIDRLEAAESECLEESRLNGMGSEREAALMAKLEAAEKNNSAWLYANAPGGWIDNLRVKCESLRARIAQVDRQEPVAWMCSDKDLIQMGYKKFSDRCEGSWDIPVFAGIPGAQAQPAPSVPREAIEKMLTQLMDIAVSNGANSISMPDEYVEVAAWLCGIPAQPAPSVPEGWIQRGMAELEAIRSRQDDDTLLDDRTLIERIGKAMLAAAQEAKPDAP